LLWRISQVAQIAVIVVAVATYFLQFRPLQKAEAQLDAKTLELKERELAFEKSYSNLRASVVSQIAVRALLECPGSKWSKDGRFAGYVDPSGHASLSDLRFAENIEQCIVRAANAEASYLTLREEDRDQFETAASLIQASLRPARERGMKALEELPRRWRQHPELFPALPADWLSSGRCGTAAEAEEVRSAKRHRCVLENETYKVVEQYVRTVDGQIKTMRSIQWKSLGVIRRALAESAASAASNSGSDKGTLEIPDGSLNRGMVRPDR
jgi:hypothetical protein